MVCQTGVVVVSREPDLVPYAVQKIIRASRHLARRGSITQRLQYPLIKEYTLNAIRAPTMI